MTIPPTKTRPHAIKSHFAQLRRPEAQTNALHRPAQGEPTDAGVASPDTKQAGSVPTSECSVVAAHPVVMMAVDPTRHPHDDTAVMMVMMPVAAVMMVMTHA